MDQHFNGNAKGQFAAGNIHNHNYAPEPEKSLYDLSKDELKQCVKHQKNIRFNAYKRKWFNIPSVLLTLMLIFLATVLYNIVYPILADKDFSNFFQSGVIMQSHQFYLIGFFAFFSIIGLWQGSKVRLENRIIRECNANIDDITVVLKSRK